MARTLDGIAKALHEEFLGYSVERNGPAFRVPYDRQPPNVKLWMMDRLKKMRFNLWRELMDLSEDDQLYVLLIWPRAERLLAKPAREETNG